MTTTEPPKARPIAVAYERAENASRRALLVVCVGALCWGVGALISVNLHELLGGALASFDTGLAAIVEHWFFQNLWLLLTFTPGCWLFGRFLGGRLPAVVFPAALTGEALMLALPFLQDGTPFESTEDFVGWVVSFVLFMIPATFAFVKGEAAFERARVQSLEDAASRRAEYDAFVKDALGSPTQPVAPQNASPPQNDAPPPSDPPAS